MTRRLGTSCVAVAMLLVAGCGGSDDGADKPAPESEAVAEMVGGCVSANQGKTFEVSPARDGIILGESGSPVIISGESDGSLCTWVPLADALVEAGHRVLLYDRRSVGTAEDEIVEVAAQFPDEAVHLIGGSIGGGASINAAARVDQGVLSVVDFSGVGATIPTVRALTAPLLVLGSEDDNNPDLAVLEKVVGAASDGTLIRLPGSAHASEAFEEQGGDTVISDIVDFIDAHDG